jgi:DNA-binding transcriptional ArsR family regulator
MLLLANPKSIEIQAKLFRGFGDPSRLGILNVLRNGPLTVSEIVEQEGHFVTYHLSDDRVGELLALAESLLADVARGVYECTRYNIPRTEARKSA